MAFGPKSDAMHFALLFALTSVPLTFISCPASGRIKPSVAASAKVLSSPSTSQWAPQGREIIVAKWARRSALSYPPEWSKQGIEADVDIEILTGKVGRIASARIVSIKLKRPGENVFTISRAPVPPSLATEVATLSKRWTLVTSTPENALTGDIVKFRTDGDANVGAISASAPMATQFNLECVGRAYTLDTKYDHTMLLSLRIDLTAHRYCADMFYDGDRRATCEEARGFQVGSATYRYLQFVFHQDSNVTIDRSTGALHGRDGNYVRTGSCEKRPFTGFPTVPFKF